MCATNNRIENVYSVVTNWTNIFVNDIYWMCLLVCWQHRKMASPTYTQYIPREPLYRTHERKKREKTTTYSIDKRRESEKNHKLAHKICKYNWTKRDDYLYRVYTPQVYCSIDACIRCEKDSGKRWYSTQYKIHHRRTHT